MGKVFGILSLVFALVSFGLSLLSFSGSLLYFVLPDAFRIIYTFLTPGLAGAAIACGGIGFAKDDSKGLAIAGLAISPIALIIFFVGFFLTYLF